MEMMYIQFVVDLGGETYIFLQVVRACRPMGARADERCWLGGSFKSAFANFAILNQIIFLLHIYTDCNFNVLDVYRNYLGHAKMSVADSCLVRCQLEQRCGLVEDTLILALACIQQGRRRAGFSLKGCFVQSTETYFFFSFFLWLFSLCFYFYLEFCIVCIEEKNYY